MKIHEGEAKLKVSVDATEKFNQAVKSKTFGWYELIVQYVVRSAHDGGSLFYIVHVYIFLHLYLDLRYRRSRSHLFSSLDQRYHRSPITMAIKRPFR